MKRTALGMLTLCCLAAVEVTGGTSHLTRDVQEAVEVLPPIIHETDSYVTLDMGQATSALSKTGEPVLPAVTRVFNLPLGSKIKHVDVTFSEADEITLSKPVQPGPEPISKIEMRAPREPVMDDAIYGSDDLYPPRTFAYRVGAGIKGSQRVTFVTIQCYPIRYSPASNKLYWSGRVDITVTYDEPAVPISFPDLYDLVIIAPEVFSEELQPLIDHKEGRGVRTVLKTTEEIYSEYVGRDEPEKIKYFIKDAIETWGADYVLLVGGAEHVPGRYTHIYFDYDYQDYWVFLSDLYYADVYDDGVYFSSWDTDGDDVFGEYNWYGDYDHVDLYPDIYLGRLACVNESEVITCVNKIIAYEAGEAHTQAWFTNLVLMGGDSLPGDAEAVDEGEYVNQHVADTLDGFIPHRVWASNGLLYYASNISDAINNGAGLVFFNGHGNTHVWATHPHESSQWIPYGSYTNSHINALSNGNQLPIVISDACYHCTYDVAPDCFGWAFLTNPNGGAIAYLGGTDVDVSYGGTAIITKGIERLCLVMSSNYKAGDATFGELWAHGVIDYIAPIMDEIDYITLEEFQPFGDPSLCIAGDSQKPLTPVTPSGETEGAAGEEYAYTTSTTDPDGDSLCYLFEWGDDTYSGWVGPHASGEIGSASHVWPDSGIYEIRVIAKDRHGVMSEWSDPLPVDMCHLRGDANGDQEIAPGDIVYLINYLFRGGPAPDPYDSGDCNCSGSVESGDIVYLVNYLFRAGPLPCC